ncbi:sugar phosphate isomerase/epimerase (plasmid) [Sphingomonas sp. NY01]|uniref:hypothetical protein n=1 Tax=Sphingomonas sp. NY01 TaxID=2968057 RepID=UPI00315CBBD8
MNQFTTALWSFDADVERYAALKADPNSWRGQMTRTAGSGLAISTVQPLVRTFGASAMQPEPRGVAARMDRLRQSIERLAPFVVNTGVPDAGDVQAIDDICTERLAELAPFGHDHGVRLTLEPPGPRR